MFDLLEMNAIFISKLNFLCYDIIYENRTNSGIPSLLFDQYLWNREIFEEDQVKNKFSETVESEIFHRCVLYIPDDDQQGWKRDRGQD